MNKIASSPEVLDRKQRLATMRLSVVEGLIAMIAIGFQQTFYVPFLNALGATPLQVGIGAGLPSLMTGLIQLGIPRWLEKTKSYKKVLFIGTFIHGLSFIPLALIAFLSSSMTVWYAIAFMGVSAAAMGFGSGAWADWMGHIVPRRRRGIYFGSRNRIINLVQLGMTVLAGHMLDTFIGKTLLIFSFIWWFGFLARTASSFLFFWHYEPPTLKQQPRQTSSFADFCGDLFSSSFGKFVLAFSLINLAANFSGPFFTLYMLNDLKLSYIQYTTLTLVPSLTTILSMKLWGRICDRIGYVIPMRLQVTGVMGLPLIWIITDNFWILILSQICASLTWGGLTLTSFNYSITAIGTQHRLSNLSYLNFISSACIFLGTTLGGLLGPHLPVFSSSQYHSIFLFSVLLRTIPMSIFQMIPEDSPPTTKLNTFERFFFDPRLNLRIGFDRIIVTKFRRPI